jgi:hypothetical protein
MFNTCLTCFARACIISVKPVGLPAKHVNFTQIPVGLSAKHVGLSANL